MSEFAAAPGYSQLIFRFQQRKCTAEFVRENLEAKPIVGWQLMGSACVPITYGNPKPLLPGEGIEVILAPGGMIYDKDGNAWKSINAFLDATVEEWKVWRGEAEKVIKRPMLGIPGFANMLSDKVSWGS
jgi:hypothetical protein